MEAPARRPGGAQEHSMNVRNLLLIAALATLGACSGRDDGTPDSGLPTGCTGACSTDGGPDSGTPDSGTPDSGTPDSGTPDGGGSCFVSNSSRPTVAVLSTDPDSGTVVNVAGLRYGRQPDGGFLKFGGHVLVNNATVEAVDFVSSDGGTVGFWVRDDSDAGFYVYKRGTDTVAANPVPGDIVNIDGQFGTQTKYFAPDGYRYLISNQYYGSGNVKNRPLIITTLTPSTGAPAPLTLDANCGMDAQDGQQDLFQDSQFNAGQLIHINGPLAITNAQPLAMAQVTELQDGGALITGYRGFEVTGGILVTDSKTYSSDGGFGAPERCDWRLLADGGATVTFPNGITGVWDTYTMHPCIDNGAGGCGTTGDNGYIPNAGALTSDAGNPTYTFALYPQSCADLAGDAGP
jgi:hypothetical protein